MRNLLTITSAALLALPMLGSAEAQAQCCPQPTVAYSPVVAAPVVQTTVSTGWYPGKYLTDFTRSVFGINDTTTTYTAGYAPYTAGYAPYTAGYAPYTAGYAPPAVGYAPTSHTAAYTPQVAYRPTYPATYGAVAAPQTVNRPVVLSPVTSAPACDACSACGGIEQVSYGAPSGGCSSCASGASSASYEDSYEDSYTVPADDYEPRPQLAPDAQVAPERSMLQKPEDEDFQFEEDRKDATEGDPAAANEYWRAPPLFPPSNRVTKRSHPAPTSMAVYHRPADVRQTAYRPDSDPADRESAVTRSQGRVNRLSADGWESAAD